MTDRPSDPTADLKLCAVIAKRAYGSNAPIIAAALFGLKQLLPDRGEEVYAHPLSPEPATTEDHLLEAAQHAVRLIKGAGLTPVDAGAVAMIVMGLARGVASGPPREIDALPESRHPERSRCGDRSRVEPASDEATRAAFVRVWRDQGQDARREGLPRSAGDLPEPRWTPGARDAWRAGWDEEDARLAAAADPGQAPPAEFVESGTDPDGGSWSTHISAGTGEHAAAVGRVITAALAEDPRPSAREVTRRIREVLPPDAPTFDEPQVHVLFGGHALCGAGRPDTWPAGSRWVGFNTDEARIETTCPGCVIAHERVTSATRDAERAVDEPQAGGLGLTPAEVQAEVQAEYPDTLAALCTLHGGKAEVRADSCDVCQERGIWAGCGGGLHVHNQDRRPLSDADFARLRDAFGASFVNAWEDTHHGQPVVRFMGVDPNTGAHRPEEYSGSLDWLCANVPTWRIPEPAASAAAAALHHRIGELMAEPGPAPALDEAAAQEMNADALRRGRSIPFPLVEPVTLPTPDAWAEAHAVDEPASLVLTERDAEIVMDALADEEPTEALRAAMRTRIPFSDESTFAAVASEPDPVCGKPYGDGKTCGRDPGHSGGHGRGKR